MFGLDGGVALKLLFTLLLLLTGFFLVGFFIGLLYGLSIAIGRTRGGGP